MKLPNVRDIGEVTNQVKLNETGVIVLNDANKAPKYGTYDMIQDILTDTKAYVAYVKQIVSTVRKSIEYKSYIQFLHGEVNLNKSALLNGVNADNGQIEIHHALFSLWDITDIVIQSYIRDNKPFQSLQIANEVMECHYKNMIPLVPLDITTHELVHSGEVFIKFEHIFGDIRKFLNKYSLGLKGEHLEILKEFVRLNKDDTVDRKNAFTLAVKPITWLEGKEYSNVGLISSIIATDSKEDKKEVVMEQNIVPSDLSPRITLK